MKKKSVKISKVSSRRKVSRNGKLNETLPIAKIREQYKNEWLAVHLTKVDRHNNPVTGIVVARSMSDVELMRQAEEYRLQNPEAQIYTFFAGNYVPRGVAVALNISQ